MNRDDVAAATMTWARDEQEERLLRESLPLLSRAGFPIFVTDAGSCEAFVDFLRSLPNFTVCDLAGRGLLAQVGRSVRAAYETGRRFILYTEPDKRDFFRGPMQEFVGDAPDSGEVGVVLASRSEASLYTFPEFQRHTEEAINRCCAEIVGARFDFTYGPFLMNRALAPFLEHAGADLGWGWRPYVFGLASRLGYRVEGLVKELPCPPEQREDSRPERVYRMRQLSQSIEGLILSTTVPVTRP